MKLLEVGQVWRSTTTGNRFRIEKLEGDKVSILRLDSPTWDDGKYTFNRGSFELNSMVLET